MGARAQADLQRRSRGAALAYVMALIVVMGILAGLGWRYLRVDNSLAAVDRWDTQAALLAHGGLDYALYRIGYPPAKQDLGYASDRVVYHVEDSSLVFRLEVKSRGLFGRALAKGVTRLPRPGRVKAAAALLGEALDLGGLPAIALTNHEGNMVLAGNAQVTGPVMLWRGDVRKANDYHIRWSGKGGHTGPLWDSLAPAWKKIQPDFGRADAWIKSQEQILAARSVSGDADYDSGSIADLRLPDSALLIDTTLRNTRILGGRYLRVAAGCRLEACKLLAVSILLDSGVTVRRSLAYASHRLVIRKAALEAGQFVARDSLTLTLDAPLRGCPVFYVSGRRVNIGRPDSSYVGALVVNRAQGEGVFISAVADRPAYDQEIHLSLRPEARLTGFLFTSGLAEMAGNLQGTLICNNLRFEYAGTIWLGHLKDAQLTALSGTHKLIVPLLFPGSAPVALGDKSL